MSVPEQDRRGRSPVREGLLTEPLENLSAVRLLGVHCSTCGETTFGLKTICPNCGRDTVEARPLSGQGSLWSYTIVRHRPPGDYRGPEPFSPFGLGLVELPDGVRVLSPLDCPVEELAVGMPLRFEPRVWRDGEREVVGFAFAAAGGAEAP